MFMLKKGLKDFRRASGMEWGMKYESRDVILDVVTTYDFMLTNTWLKKMDSHLITFKALQTLVE